MTDVKNGYINWNAINISKLLLSSLNFLTNHNVKPSMMIAFVALTVFVQSVFGGNLVEVLQNDGETTLISLVKQAGLADALLSGHLHAMVTLYFKHILNYFIYEQVNSTGYNLWEISSIQYQYFLKRTGLFLNASRILLHSLRRERKSLPTTLSLVNCSVWLPWI